MLVVIFVGSSGSILLVTVYRFHFVQAANVLKACLFFARYVRFFHFVSSSMFFALSYVQLAVSSLHLFWPTRCPDVSCPSTAITERVPESIALSLKFAQETAQECQRQSLGMSGFWIGFLFGICFAIALGLLLFACRFVLL